MFCLSEFFFFFFYKPAHIRLTLSINVGTCETLPGPSVTLQMALLVKVGHGRTLSSNPGQDNGDYECLISRFKRSLRTAGHGEGHTALIFALQHWCFIHIKELWDAQALSGLNQVFHPAWEWLRSIYRAQVISCLWGLKLESGVSVEAL